jgi:drug/metabolite transporter (DMT)-like permease
MNFTVPDSARWIFLSLGAAAGWGLQYAITENMLKNTKGLTWLTQYFVLGAIGCIGVNLLTNNKVPLIPTKSDFFPMLLCVAVGLFAQAAINGAILSKNATQASLLENAVPLFAFLFSGLLFGRWEITPRTFVGSVCIFSGLALVGSR